jgi:hypoxanthine phosphoribosyltransferase
MHRIADQIKGFQFDWYVAITRGGLIPAAMLAQITGQRHIDTFCVQRYGADNKERTITNVDCKNLKHFKNRSILVIDDLLDKGVTMKFVVDMIKMYNPSVLKTAVLYWKTSSAIVPDFYIEKCSDDRWITFSWEVEQTIGV